MIVVIYTYDLLPGREHLMPWRTVIEVTKYFKNKRKTNCIILNGSNDIPQNERFFDEIKIKTIDKSFDALANFVQTNSIDVIFYPVSVRDGLKNIGRFNDLKINKIAYYPGGIYSLKGTTALWKISDFSTAKPYLLEITIPKFLIFNKLRKSGFSKLVTMSAYTAEKLKSKHWQSNVAAIPGYDDFSKLILDDTILEKNQLQNSKFYLFTGSAAPIRGSLHLLNAFDKFAQNNQDAKLVMLMRKDVNGDSKSFYKAFENIKNKTQITVINEYLNREQLKSFFSKAYAVVLPFLLIPSEIPLTYFEVLSCSTPIITFKNGGTYQYIKQCSIGVSSRKSTNLANAMDLLWHNEESRKQLSDKAKKLMAKHPTWSKMGETWFNAI